MTIVRYLSDPLIGRKGRRQTMARRSGIVMPFSYATSEAPPLPRGGVSQRRRGDLQFFCKPPRPSDTPPRRGAFNQARM